MRMSFTQPNPDIDLESFAPQAGQIPSDFKRKLANRLPRHYLFSNLGESLARLLPLNLPGYAYSVVLILAILVIPAVVFGQDLYQLGKLYYLRTFTDPAEVYTLATSQRSGSDSLSGLSAWPAVPLETADSSEDKIAIDPNFHQETNLYTINEIQVEVGPQALSCKAYTAYDPTNIPSYRSVIYGYVTEDFNYYTKSITFDQTQGIIAYSLSTPTEWIEYKGGQYAVQTEIPPLLKVESSSTAQSTSGVATQGVPVAEGVSELDPISSIGSSVASDSGEAIERNDQATPDDTVTDLPTIEPRVEPQLISVESEGGVEYYVYQNDYDIYCEGEEPAPGIQRYWINPQTHQIYRDLLYIESVSDGNLLTRTSYQYQSEKVNFDQVSGQFKFEVEVPIKTITNPTDQELLKNYLVDRPLTVIMPTSEVWKLSYVYSQAASDHQYQSGYLFDRSFYANGAVGEYLYQNFVAQGEMDTEYLRLRTDLEMQFTNAENVNLTVSIYPSQVSKDQILQYLQSEFSGQPENFTVTINGNSQNIEVHKLAQRDLPVPVLEERKLETERQDDSTLDSREQIILPIEPGTDGSVVPPSNRVGTSLVMYFERDNLHYLIRLDAYQIENYDWKATLTNWTDYRMNNADEYAKFYEIIKQVTSPTITNLTEPDSAPVPEQTTD